MIIFGIVYLYFASEYLPLILQTKTKIIDRREVINVIILKIRLDR